MNNHTPHISDQEVSLIPFNNTFLTPTYISWLNDKDTVRYSELRHRQHDVKNCLSYFESMMSQEHFFWAIIDVESQTHIGNLSAYHDKRNQIAELAILIGDKTFKGKGYGYLAWALAQNYLLEKQIVRKTAAGTMSINKPMLAIFDKSGMTIEGTRRDHYLWEGQPVDIILAGKSLG